VLGLRPLVHVPVVLPARTVDRVLHALEAVQVEPKERLVDVLNRAPETCRKGLVIEPCHFAVADGVGGSVYLAFLGLGCLAQSYDVTDVCGFEDIHEGNTGGFTHSMSKAMAISSSSRIRASWSACAIASSG